MLSFPFFSFLENDRDPPLCSNVSKLLFLRLWQNRISERQRRIFTFDRLPKQTTSVPPNATNNGVTDRPHQQEKVK